MSQVPREFGGIIRVEGAKHLSHCHVPYVLTVEPATQTQETSSNVRHSMKGHMTTEGHMMSLAGAHTGLPGTAPTARR